VSAANGHPGEPAASEEARGDRSQRERRDG